ncbi:MAG: CvpA family protein [Armatimonadota bacterium]
MNWLDAVVILFLAAFVYAGIQTGFISGIYRLAGLIFSIAVPFLLYAPLGRLFISAGLRRPYAEPLAFILLWLLASVVYFGIGNRAIRRVPRHIWGSGVNKALGMFPWLIHGLIIATLVLALLSVTYTSRSFQSALNRSILARGLLQAVTPAVAKGIAIFGQLVQDNCGFLTVNPIKEERVMLGYRVPDPVPDTAAEAQMLGLVNAERTRRGLRPLVMDESLRRVARAHSADMFRRGYFSHESLGGASPFARIRRGRARFTAAGENIALSPTVNMAQSGLMKSAGHRENILRPVFGRVGIGVVRGGIHGMMFTQDFTN